MSVVSISVKVPQSSQSPLLGNEPHRDYIPSPTTGQHRAPQASGSNTYTAHVRYEPVDNRYEREDPPLLYPPATGLPRRFKHSRIGNPHIDMRGVWIIFGQLGHLILAWGFFLAIAARDQPTPITLNSSIVQTIMENPKWLNILVTLVATCLSASTTMLFSLAVRYGVYLYLFHSVSLFVLRVCIQISNHSLLFYRDHLKWTFIALFSVATIGSLTAGWSSLLMPVPVLIETEIHGQDVDLLGEAFNRGFAAFSGNQTELPEIDALFRQPVESSGLAATIAYIGTQSIFSFDDQVYNGSTGGILPAFLKPTNGVGLNRTANVFGNNIPLGLKSNYSMTQQGFTADVNCRYRTNLVAGQRSPPLTIFHNSVVIDDPAATATNMTLKQVLNSWRWMTICDGEEVWANSTVTLSNNTVASLACRPPTSSNDGIYDFAVQSQGIYGPFIGDVVCSIFPKVTKLKVDYGGSVINSSAIASSNSSAHPVTMGNYAVGIVVRRFLDGQNLNGNSVGDALMSLILNLDQKVFWDTEDVSLKLLEAYIRGIMEYSATLLRTIAMVTAYRSDELRPFVMNMTMNTTGVYRTETIGYNHRRGVEMLILLPVTLITLASIAIVVIASRSSMDAGRGISRLDKEGGETGKRPIHNHETSHNSGKGAHLDIGDPFHLMTICADGKMGSVFRGGIDESELIETHTTRVKLATMVTDRRTFSLQPLHPIPA
ncbi:hypothetical protein BDQ12DRAFT_717243 [Crucibulum laeve]|uniref:Uncharacterized protein n=1 Tax=Crucibulum laeve TaxID=68775 RepID=A0A5C3MHB7_9AGAR|nr:hypothetical protein BDQ12DRAFT_717243 [Crucibulum laeve]